MTRARHDHPTRRIVRGGRYGDLVVTIGPDLCEVRQKGRRTTYAVPWAAVHDLAGRLAARALVAAKRAKKRGAA